MPAKKAKKVPKPAKKKPKPKPKVEEDPILKELKAVKRKIERGEKISREAKEEIKTDLHLMKEKVEEERETLKAEEEELEGLEKTIEQEEDEIDTLDKPEKKESLKISTKSTEKGTKVLIFAIIALVVIFILLFSLKYLISGDEPKTIEEELREPITENTDTKYSYNGFNFILREDFWFTEVFSKKSNRIYGLQLRYGPKDLENITIEGDPLFFSTKNDLGQAYITFDPTGNDLTNVALTVAELSLNLARGLGVEPSAACIRNKTRACIDRPIVTCPNSEFFTIYVKEAEETKVIADQNCITIQGSGSDLVKAEERLLMKWYGIMP